VTQNVDDLHERAGSRDVIGLHGSLMRARCSAGCPGTMVPTDAQAAEPPRCPACGALMRPDVVWFGEQMPMAEFEAARHAAVACDVFLSVGTSNVVEPAASLPWISATHGATVIVVNASMEGQRRGPSILPIEGPAGVMLPRLLAEAFAGRRVRRQESVAPPIREGVAPQATLVELPTDAPSRDLSSIDVLSPNPSAVHQASE
jgi:NAD-dependent deacetylase